MLQQFNLIKGISVIENVMLNQPIPLGTGLPGLLAKMTVEGKKALENVKEHKVKKGSEDGQDDDT